MHIGISGGLESAARRAAEIGCETMQIFAANPNSWRSPALNPDVAAEFHRLTVELGITPLVIHTPYLLNLASPDPEIHGKSTAALSDAMHRAELLGAQYVVTHIGSHKGTSPGEGIAKVCQGVTGVLDQIDLGSRAMLLLENSAGSGNSVGSSFDELGAIMECLTGYHDRVGICLDTAHLWGAGYDLSSAGAVGAVISDFGAKVGLDHLKVVHMNDTHVALGAHRDRHANVGTGHIGEAGFAALLNHPALTSLACIIETPPRPAEDAEHDVDILKRLRIC